MRLLEMMVVEYAFKKPDTQDVLKPLALSFLMQVARQYATVSPAAAAERRSDRMAQYIKERSDTVTLKEMAAHFSYHPNYISSLLRKEQGKTFSKLVLEQRMERALVLLKGTTLSVQEIALLLGYSNSSNFYKAFQSAYGSSPREYMKFANGERERETARNSE